MSDPPHAGALRARVASSRTSELLPARREAEGQLPIPFPTVLGALDLDRGRWILVLEVPRGLVVSAVVEDGDGLRRAGAGDGVAERLLASIGTERDRDAFTFRRLGAIVGGSEERAIDVDQSNESIVVGGEALVKRFVWTTLGNERPIVLPAHLGAAGFTEMPAPLGSAVWRHDGGIAPIASVTSYLPGARDGWDWYVELLDRSIDDASLDPVEPAAALGALSARLHVALATPTEVLPSPRAVAQDGDMGGWRRDAERDLETALASIDGDEGLRLRGREAAIRDELSRFPTGTATTIPIHGDLHVGQFLLWRDGLAVSDLDGDPLGSGSLGGAPAKDVASLVQSLDHVGRIVERRRDVSVEAWIQDATVQCLRAYRGELASRGAASLFDEALLRPLRVAQELHEFVYAAEYLPGWRYVPDRSLAAILDAG